MNSTQMCPKGPPIIILTDACNRNIIKAKRQDKNFAIFMPLSFSLIFAVFYPLWVLRVVRLTRLRPALEAVAKFLMPTDFRDYYRKAIRDMRCRHRAEMPPDAGGCRVFAVFWAFFLPYGTFSTYAM